MFFCAFGPMRLRLNSSIGSPKPLADCLAVVPAGVTTSPEMRPIGRMIAAMAERSPRAKVCAKPVMISVASKSAPGVTVWPMSNGLVLPLIELTMSGTALPPDSDFQ